VCVVCVCVVVGPVEHFTSVIAYSVWGGVVPLVDGMAGLVNLQEMLPV
jgi:hypothetical protein